MAWPKILEGLPFGIAIANGMKKDYTFVGGDAYSAPVAIEREGTKKTVCFLLRDHLGSITHVAANDGSLKYEYGYDERGRQRGPSDLVNYDVGKGPAQFMGRGFTGHEHLPWFNLINMNGRLYDPLAGRMLSPDNYVQTPYKTQGYNRYAYCMNNPLVYTDRDGNFVWLPFIIGAVIGGYVGGSLANNDWSPWNGGWDMNLSTFFGIGFGALAGGLGGQWLFGPGGVMSGGTSLNITLSTTFNNVGTAFANFSVHTGITLEGVGYVTAAGGGAYLAGTAINNWLNGGDGKPSNTPEQIAGNAIAGAREKASAQWANNLGLTASLDGTGMPQGGGGGSLYWNAKVGAIPESDPFYSSQFTLHYIFGDGSPIHLSNKDFSNIYNTAVKKNAIEWNTINNLGNNRYSVSVNFYNTTFDLKNAFGRATFYLQYDKGHFISTGFYDYWDLDPKASRIRPGSAESTTRFFNSILNGNPFKIIYP